MAKLCENRVFSFGENNWSPKVLISEQINSPMYKTHHSGNVVQWHCLPTSDSKDRGPHEETRGKQVVEKILKAWERCQLSTGLRPFQHLLV